MQPYQEAACRITFSIKEISKYLKCEMYIVQIHLATPAIFMDKTHFMEKKTFPEEGSWATWYSSLTAADRGRCKLGHQRAWEGEPMACQQEMAHKLL